MNKKGSGELNQNIQAMINGFVNSLDKLNFDKFKSRIGASQHYIISELEKIGEDRYLIAEERVSRTDIVFFDPDDLKPVIGLEYEQSGRYLETIQKMKKFQVLKKGGS